MLAVIIYLGTSALRNDAGFPLDDAWIHQTYARNMAEKGEWAFIPGQPSAGATSPLWVAMIALGVRLGLGPFFWTFFLGWLCLWAAGILAAWSFAILLPARQNLALWVGVLIIFEWHLVWASVSGMETALFAILCLSVFLFVLRKERDAKAGLIAGLLAGLSVLVRPEGITLLVPLLAAVLLKRSVIRVKLKSTAFLLIGFAILFVPYLIFNNALSGSLWPNTFYAKQAEYAALLAQPFWTRLGQQFFQPLVGTGLLLVPGALFFLVQAVKEKRWRELFPLAWAGGFLILFAFRLPVIYQHGRYALPVIPIYVMASVTGAVSWIDTQSRNCWRRRFSLAWVQGLAMISVLIYAVGATAFTRDVAFINTEMVATARWVNANTQPGALIAAHDIGALGYFGHRSILDLAGLVSPGVIPFIRDEARLKDYLDQQGADYLVTFPDWYPQLTMQAEMVYQTGGLVSPALGGENMAVYRWPSPSH